MHLHASAIDLAIFAAMLIIVGTLFRVVAAHYSDRPLGKALSFIY